MAGIQAVITRQQEIGEELERRGTEMDNNEPRRSLRYVTRRIGIVEKLWNEFKANDAILRTEGDATIPYFINNYYGIVETIREELSTKLREIKDGLQLDPSSDSDTSQKERSSDEETESDPETDSNEQPGNANSNENGSKSTKSDTKSNNPWRMHVQLKRLIKSFDL